ncbi:lysylphosphatidylglycerol synthase transmembrane domain-containing protein [Methanosphaerula palustris]|uniref:Lysylphosphatidylglycerol synthetase/UPF0104 n=1 Tax=Methanosphaerula palustris (strain ATCC BAA-1556 / DSM 19958 / E1-9c) TaxID=521011 RepID=B8GJH8_METPE|nr:flippase-like domain-containing protein [Methanosphaerula palustris]ACL17019.1 conserved hypothetical protein [Methanosphaerula palustris E1-9c]
MERSQIKWVWISIAFSLLVLVGVMITTYDKNTLNYLLHFNPYYLLLAIGLRTSSLVFWALRIQKMAKSLGYKIPFFYSLNLVMANLLAGAITPGQAGGEPVRVHELYRADVKVGDATAIVIMERVLDGVVLTLMGIIAMLTLGGIWQSLSIEVIIAMMVAWTFMIGIVILLIFAARKPERAKKLILRVLSWAERKTPVERLKKSIVFANQEIDNFFAALNFFTSRGRRGLFEGTVFTILFWSSEFFVASLLLVALGQHPFIAESFLFQLIIAVVMMVPLTPGSSGIAELSATSLYVLIIPSSIVGVFVLLWRALLYYFNIIVGLVASLIIVRREMKRTGSDKSMTSIEEQTK